MRVLHVIDPGSPGGGACTLQLLSAPLSRLNSVEQDVLLVGTNRHEQLARRCGVEPTGRITAPRNQPILSGLAGRNFKTFLEIYQRGRRPYDIIHAWTARSLLLTTLVAPDHRRLATFAVGPVNGFLMQALAALLSRRPATILATSVQVKRDYVVMGIPESQIEILPPAVHPEAVVDEVGDRETVRERWGLTSDDEGVFVIGLMAEPANWCDARRAMGVISPLAESGRDVRLALHPLAQRRNDARRWAARLGLDHRMILDDDLAEPWRSINGLDAALLLGDDTTTLDLADHGSPFSLLTGGGRSLRPMTGVMPALWAMGLGVPVVAERSMAMAEIIDDEGTGFLVDQHDVNAAADRLARLYDDRALHRLIAQAARAHVHQRYHVSAYCVRLREMYERLIEGWQASVVTEDSEVVEERHYVEYRR